MPGNRSGRLAPALFQTPGATECSASLLASARPAWQAQTSADLPSLFKPAPTAARRIPEHPNPDQVVDTLAPRARAILGADRLAEFVWPPASHSHADRTSPRPKRRQTSGQLDHGLLGIRPGELIGWLHKRLRGYALLPEPPARSLKTPSRAYQAITAMLTAGVQKKERLIACGSLVLDGNAEQAEHLLGHPAGDGLGSFPVQ